MRRIAALAIACLALSGAVAIVATPAGAAPVTPGAFVPIDQTRVVSTSSGIAVPVAPLHGGATITPTLAGVPSNASAVEVTITAAGGTAPGVITAYKPLTARPSTIVDSYNTGQTTTNTAIVAASGSKISIYVGAATTSTVNVVVDLQGYYLGGVVPAGPGLYHPTTPQRLINTAGALGATGPVAGGHYILAKLTNTSGGIPASGVGSVAVAVTVTAPTSSGGIIAYVGSPRPTQTTLHFSTGQRTTAFAIVPVTSSGYAVFYNASTGSVQLTIDAVGYFAPQSTATTVAGGLQRTQLWRAYSGTVSGQATRAVTVTGQGGMPLNSALVAAALVVVHVSYPHGAGFFTAYKGGLNPRPDVRSLSFATNQTTSNLLQVGVSSTGQIFVFNSAFATATVTVDVYGYVRATDTPTPPTPFLSRYIRALGGRFEGGSGTDDGCLDANAGYHFVLLHIGAQLNNGTGVQLSATSTNVTYAQLVSAIHNYELDFTQCGGTGTIAVATNNDAADWTGYTAAQRGADWATKVINLIPTGGKDGFAGPSVVGAFDAEPDFGTTHFSDALGWEGAYLSHITDGFHVTPNLPAVSKLPAGRKLIFTGAASGCPTTLGSTTACNSGWTPAQLYGLAHVGSVVLALPQIYTTALAAQWANIDKVGGGGIAFVGSLTEAATCAVDSSGCPSLSPSDGWTALSVAMSGVFTSGPALPYAIDLREADPAPA